jgi:hypothetical protein|tara:strand:- start:2968 stop:3321 length:354 start_codon:yes stop_codon:yes gene_type:complete
MATFSINDLSGATTGMGVKVVATASAGTTIHTAVAGTSDWDQIEMFAVNNDTTDRLLTIQWGGTTTVDNDIPRTIPAQSGMVPIVPPTLLQNGLVIRAYAAAANKIVIYGNVVRITA